MVSGGPFDDQAYREHQEKRCRKREHGKDADKQRGSPRTTGPRREVGSQSSEQGKRQQPRHIKKNRVRAALNDTRPESKFLKHHQENHRKYEREESRNPKLVH